jgi:YesN/AraC family two-component response regulator
MNPLFEAYQPGELVQTYRIINTPSDFAKKALFYVQETGYLKSLKSHLSKRSHLNSFLFIIVRAGKGTFTYKNNIYYLKQNDCLFINCKYHYTHQSDEEDPWELLWVHFNGHSACDYYQYFQQSNDIVFHSDVPEGYIQIIHKLIDIHQKKPAVWELTASKLITDLLTDCLRPQSDLQKSSESIIEKIYSIRTYCDQHYNTKIQLGDLADNFYISKFHLCREFKKVYGLTIIDYLTMQRITYAKELLRFTTQSIEEVAAASGYPDASYFNKVFRKIESMTASEYRKQWRG